jgi:hypothetical protein
VVPHDRDDAPTFRRIDSCIFHRCTAASAAGQKDRVPCRDHPADFSSERRRTLGHRIVRTYDANDHASIHVGHHALFPIELQAIRLQQRNS